MTYAPPTAQDPERRRQANILAAKNSRKRKRISLKRKDAREKRKDQQGGQQESSEEESSGSEGVSSSDESCAGKESEVSDRTKRRRRAKERSREECLVTSLQTFTKAQQVDMACHLLALPTKPRTSDILDNGKMRMRISKEAAVNQARNRLSNWSNFSIKKHAAKAVTCLSNSSEPEVMLESYIQEQLLSCPIMAGLLLSQGIEVDPLMATPETTASQASLRIAANLATKRTGKDRFLGVRHAVLLAKELDLTVRKRGDVGLLCKTIVCSPAFSRKVLLAIESGSEQQLFVNVKRRGSIAITQWPQILKEYFLQPENSRAVPGHETVSIRYGVRVEKFLLLRSRKEVVRSFKELHPDCPFSDKILFRESPQNVVTPTKRDLIRNACPLHSNARHQHEALRKVGLLKDVSSSCRDMASSVICHHENFSPLEPLTWKEDCALRKCPDCPKYKVGHLALNVHYYI